MADITTFQRITSLSRGTNVKAINAAKFFSGGVMSSSAAASLILFEVKRVLFVAVLIFISAAIAFAWLYLGPVIEFGPYALAAAAVLGIGAYSSARTTLKELVPWMPAIICFFLFLTVFVGPIIRSIITEDNPDGDATLEEGTHYSLDTVPRPLPSLISSTGSRYGPSPLANHLIEHEVSHMSRSEYRFPNRSQHSSDINLSEGLDSRIIAARRMMSPSRVALYSEMLSHSPPVIENLREMYPHLVVGPSGHRSSPTQSDSPPGSEVADHSMPDSATSNSAEPLLESTATER